MKYVVDVVMQPGETEDKRIIGRLTRKMWEFKGAVTCSSYLLLIWMLLLFKASNIMAMWLRYSVMAVSDMQLVSRDTKACTSPTFSLRINMTAMAAYGLGPWRLDTNDVKTLNF